MATEVASLPRDEKHPAEQIVQTQLASKRPCSLCKDRPSRVSVHEVSEALVGRGWADPTLTVQQQRDQPEHWVHLWNELVDQFTEDNQAVVDYYPCRSIPGACIQTTPLTDKGTDQLHLVIPCDERVPAWITDHLMAIQSLHSELRPVLARRDARTCTDSLAGLAVQLLRQAERYAFEAEQRDIRISEQFPKPSDWYMPGDQDYGPNGELKPDAAAKVDASQKAYARVHEQQAAAHERELQILLRHAASDPLKAASTRQLTLTRDFFKDTGERAARSQYTSGMFWSLFAVLVVVIIGVMVWFNGWLGFQRSESLGDVLGLQATALIFGGIGAVVSVMQRMTAGRLSLGHRASSDRVFLLGLFRPLIGAVVASVVLMLVHSGLITSAAIPEGAQALWYFSAAIAFVAGFSERWAQDVLASAEGTIVGGIPKTAGDSATNQQPEAAGAS